MDGVGAYGLTTLRRRTTAPHDWPNAPPHRSDAAVYAAARRSFGPGGLTRGAYTLKRLTEATGYSRSQLTRARDALGQKWRRLRPGGAYIVTEDQMLDLVGWLKHDYWDKDLRLYCCLECQTESAPPAGLGLCGRCYHQYRRLCLRLGLPTTQAAQSDLLTQVADEVDEKFVEEVSSQIARHRALGRRYLKRLAAAGRRRR